MLMDNKVHDFHVEGSSRLFQPIGIRNLQPRANKALFCDCETLRFRPIFFMFYTDNAYASTLLDAPPSSVPSPNLLVADHGIESGANKAKRL